MTSKLPVVDGRQVARVAERIGFRLHRQKGSHAIYYRDSDKARVVIPMHAGKTIKPGTLLSMISDMGLTTEKFRELL